MKIKSTLICLIVCGCIFFHAQSQDSLHSKIYKTKPQLEIPVPAAFFVGTYFGFKALDKYSSMTEEDVLKLNPETINAFDRPVAYYDPAAFQHAQASSDLILNLTVASPVLLILDKKIRRDWQDILGMFLVTHAVDNTIYFSAAFGVRRPRPLVFNPGVAMPNKTGIGKSDSFFSGHTSWTATSTFLMAKIYTDYHQIKGFRRILIYTGAAVPPSLVGYFRIHAGKHFKSDVITGAVVGAACGILIPEFHRIKNKDSRLSFRPFVRQGAQGISAAYILK